MSEKDTKRENAPMKRTSLRILSFALAIMIASIGFGDLLTENAKAHTVTELASGTAKDLWDVEWRSDGDYALIVGSSYDDFMALKYDGNTFEELGTAVLATDFMGVGWNGDNTFAVLAGSRFGYSPLWEFDGSTFTDIAGSYKDVPMMDFAWKPYDSYGIIPAWDKSVYKYDGVSVSRIYEDSTPFALGFRRTSWKGDGTFALTVGTYGTVLGYDGNTFTTLVNGDTSPFTGFYWDVSWKPDGSYALIVGDKGRVVKYDGYDFEELSSGTSKGLTGVDWSPTGNTALIVGYDTILKFDGNSFEQLTIPVSDKQLIRVSWHPYDGSALVVGYDGVVLRVSGLEEQVKPPRASRNPTVIPGYKSQDYALEYEIVNEDDSRTIVVRLLLTESSGGKVLRHYSLEYEIQPGESRTFRFVLNNDWEWVKGNILADLVFGVGQINTWATVAANTWPKLAEYLASIPALQGGMEFLGKTIPWVRIILALVKLGTLDLEEVFSYTIQDTVTYKDGTDQTYRNIITGLDRDVSVTLRVPWNKFAAVIAEVAAIIIASGLTLWTLSIPVVNVFVGAGEAIYVAIDYFVISPSVAEDPPVAGCDPPTLNFYEPSLPEPDDTLSIAMNESIFWQTRFLGHGRAMYESYEKYQNAKENKDTDCMAIQLDYMKKYSLLVSEDIYQIDRQYEIVVRELHNKGVTITESDIISAKARIRQEGIPDELPFLQDLNVPIDRIYNHIDLLLNINNDWVIDYDILRQMDMIPGFIPLWVGESPIGGSFPDIQPPVADIYTEKSVYKEGETACFDASGSQAPDGEIISYEWDFNEDGATDAVGVVACFIWYDNIDSVTVTLTITSVIFVTETDDYGNEFEYPVYRTATTIKTVTIINVPPVVSIDAAYMYVDFTLRMAGEKWHNVEWTLFESSDGSGWTGIRHLDVERYAGSPNVQSKTVYDVYIDMEKFYKFVASYDPYDDPINGQIQGSTPVWVDLTYEDNSTERIHHNFNVEQSIFRDTDRWIHCEAWCIDLSPWFVGHWVNFEATVTDVGTDDITLIWDFDDLSLQENRTFHTYRPTGVNDSYPSPYDKDEGSYPMVVQVVHNTANDETNERQAVVMHRYTYEGDFDDVTLTAIDDDDHDKGIGWDVLDIEAIHTEHVCPVK